LTPSLAKQFITNQSVYKTKSAIQSISESACYGKGIQEAPQRLFHGPAMCNFYFSSGKELRVLQKLTPNSSLSVSAMTLLLVKQKSRLQFDGSFNINTAGKASIWAVGVHKAA